MFIGREEELNLLKKLTMKDNASLVTITGRRRIGKSRLIQQFGKNFKKFYEFQGLSPRDTQKNADQLRHFEDQLKSYTTKTIPRLENWFVAFDQLAKISKKGTVLILLDEISWMSQQDPDLPGQIKLAWDTKLKLNPDLILVLCGSVSSWIEDNILKSTDFVGRVSLRLQLKELPLRDCKIFLERKHSSFNSYEILKILSITGGVPKYLEELDVKSSVEQNIIDLCYKKTGILFNEFDSIFGDIFGSRSKIYKKIVNALILKKESAKDLANRLGFALNGDFSEYLHHLEISGLIARDYTFFLGRKDSKLSRYRIRDNYLRFFLKFIRPHQKKINADYFEIKSVTQLIKWDSILGLQFENLILNNAKTLLDKIHLDESSVINFGPFFQKKSSRNKGSCQVDLLIETAMNMAYICEIKCRDIIDSKIISEVQKKIEVIAAPKRFSLRPVLIYDGEISPRTFEKLRSYFDYIVSFDDLL